MELKAAPDLQSFQTRTNHAAYHALTELERDGVSGLLRRQVSLMLCGCLLKAVSGAGWCLPSHGLAVCVTSLGASDSRCPLQPSIFLSFPLTDSLMPPMNTEVSCLTVVFLMVLILPSTEGTFLTLVISWKLEGCFGCLGGKAELTFSKCLLQ